MQEEAPRRACLSRPNSVSGERTRLARWLRCHHREHGNLCPGGCASLTFSTGASKRARGARALPRPWLEIQYAVFGGRRTCRIVFRMIEISSAGRQFSRYSMSAAMRLAMSSLLRASPRSPRTWASPGDAGLDEGPHLVVRQLPREERVVLKQVWARADHAHVALEHIPELRQFVDARKFAEPTCGGVDALVVLRGLPGGGMWWSVRMVRYLRMSNSRFCKPARFWR